MGTEEPHTTLSIMDIKKQALTSASHSDFTLEALRQIAPSAFTEVRDEQGELTHKVDFDVLKELLGDKILDSDEERFGFYWVGKQDAKRAAAEPTRKTLRPVLEDSVDWDNTQNLYIEGDNLEVLKLLQRAYLGKVKMIYIDPPYNTGNDFVYDDDFAMSREDMDDAMGNLDEEGNRLRRNLDSNPRYHSDWCSMIYSRLLVARTLLSNDGVIFISIDDNEVHHLRKICDEVFGAGNFVAIFPWRKRTAKSDVPFGVSQDYEWILSYAKTGDFIACVKGKERKYYTTDDYPNKPWRVHDLTKQTTSSERPNSFFTIINPKTQDEFLCNPNRTWAITGETFLEYYAEGRIVFPGDYDFLNISKPVLRYWMEDDIQKDGERFGKIAASTDLPKQVGMSQDGTKQVTELFSRKIFTFPKPINLIKHLVEITNSPSAIILDFFSGSATTAHAVMQLNAEDGGKRKYICVQLPEETPEGSEARKAGYSTICEIGKERIRRAGKDILSNLYGKQTEILSNFSRFAIGEDVDKDPKLWKYIEDEATREQAKQDLEAINERIQNLDTGFRVLRVDTSNMEEVYFEPATLRQDQLFGQVDSVKEDRSDLDLLFGCMVDWGVELSYPLRQEEVAGKHLYIVNEGALVACFEEDIDLEVIRAIAKLEPLRVLFRESCFASDADKLNIYEQFKQFCGWSAEESYRRIHVM